MAKYLGLYIEDNLIKYAKVSKEQTTIKVESFGVKTYENLKSAIDQIVQETYSQKIPISMNLTTEDYNYFDMSNLLTKQYLDKAINMEFSYICNEKNINANAFEARYAVVENEIDKEKFRVIHVTENKNRLNKHIQQLAEYSVRTVTSLPITLSNLINLENQENFMVVNVEGKTTITTVYNNNIYDVIKLEEGSQQFLDDINIEENSMSKAYEIAKNTTIYTSKGTELQEFETQYLEKIMPVLYNIVGKVKKEINNSILPIKKVYITGTAALINNVDLYFQEYLPEVNCEIIVPHFIPNNPNINIKDYIEVNSAISLALAGLGEGVQGMNFKKVKFGEKIPSIGKKQTKGESKSKPAFMNSRFFDLGEKFDATERWLARTALGMFICVSIFSGISAYLNIEIVKKDEEIQTLIDDTESQIAKINTDNSQIQEKTAEYTSLIKNIEDANNKIDEINKVKNAIPNLLNQIMVIIPQNVQLLSVENTSGDKIVIEAQAEKYEQLGFFIAEIKTDGILGNVISTSGQKEGGVVTIRIEGELL